MVADGDHVVELDVGQLVDVLRALARDVDARLGHDLHGVADSAVGRDAGRVGLDHVALQVPRPAFGHLAAAGVAGAEEQDDGFVGHVVFAYPNVMANFPPSPRPSPAGEGLGEGKLKYNNRETA